MKRLTSPLFVGVVLLFAVAAYNLYGSNPTPVVAQPAVDAAPMATLTPTATARWCPTLTPEPFWVDPVTSPTDLLKQAIRVHIGNGEAVTVTLESGVFTTTGNFSGGNLALVDVALLPNTRHKLLVAARVRSWYLWEGCTIGGYTLWTTGDRNGRPLVIEQQAGTVTPTVSPTATPSPTPTLCPMATPEPLWVEPVISPTDLLTQMITVRIGNGEAVTVTAESGTFTAAGNFDAYGRPAQVQIDLLANVTHHLAVQASVRRVEQWGCVYGGYMLHTERDRDGQPLLIEQRPVSRLRYLPMIQK